MIVPANLRTVAIYCIKTLLKLAGGFWWELVVCWIILGWRRRIRGDNPTIVRLGLSVFLDIFVVVLPNTKMLDLVMIRYSCCVTNTYHESSTLAKT